MRLGKRMRDKKLGGLEELFLLKARRRQSEWLVRSCGNLVLSTGA